ncbi:ABC transporter ATP-binding protein [Aquitalea sp.]|uniref:ABC transporter ATP-binding protein n=1 Tax=Aquitalea sp. TaxID=1872623 RepID=UPI002584A92B|nr:ABC transporter ATP-binding protein [Aquitalea sp.]
MSETVAPLLSLAHISLSFKGVKAVTDIGFDVAEGEICALIGPNGAGKSSLLNVINGVYQPQQGEIRFAGRARRAMQPHEAAVAGIARTFQNIALFKGMSVLDNILTGRNLASRSSWLEQAFRVGRAVADEEAQRAVAEEVIAFLRLQAWRHTPVGQLPYGLQKRVELGRALAARPRLLLLDEPMAGMNREEKREMSQFIREVNQVFGTTIVLIEHDIGVVMELSDHVVVLDYGRKIGDGEPEAVRALPEVIAAYLGQQRH